MCVELENQQQRGAPFFTCYQCVAPFFFCCCCNLWILKLRSYIHPNKWISISHPGLVGKSALTRHCIEIHRVSTWKMLVASLECVNRIIRLILCTMRTQPQHHHSNQVLNSVWCLFCIFPARVVLTQSSSRSCCEFVDKLSGTTKVRAGLSAF